VGYSGRLVTETEFRAEVIAKLYEQFGKYDYVTGPGRSGAVAAVYASHYLGIPFVPYKHKSHGDALIVDTAAMSGRTIRKASREYGGADYIVMFNEPPRVRFWYEELSRGRGKGGEFI
jgi:hypothetical protein